MCAKDEGCMSPVTPASQQRRELAMRLAQACPPELGAEIAVTGSSARGLADDESDLEVNLWVERLPPLEARMRWLAAAGVEQLSAASAPRPDGSEWITGRIEGVMLEAGWQSFAALAQALEGILSGQASRQTLAELVASAVPLRPGPRLAGWQARLAHVPPVLREQALAQAQARLHDAEHWQGRLRLARRGERLALFEALGADLGCMLRLLYALNDRWDPGARWLLSLASDFARAPVNWRARLAWLYGLPLEGALDETRRLLSESAVLAAASS